jgi:plasmid maintenance system antidote protein VapI
MELYGLQITALLKKMDWSQKTLAHHLRVTPQYINALVSSL